ncbi:MAG: ATP-binding protein, partial [Gammaproteobacteria bacterium]
ELEAMLDGVRSADPARLGSLQQEVLRLTHLIEDLHLLSLAESGGLRLLRAPADLVAIARAAAARFEDRLHAAGFSVELALPSAPLPVEVDVQRIEQVLGNLFENVLRHASPPGPLRIEAGAQADEAWVAVSDACPGVPAQTLAHLFDRLYRVESARSRGDGGAGLGLAICRSIVEAHGGRISAEPSARGGLRVRIALPVGDIG